MKKLFALVVMVGLAFADAKPIEGRIVRIEVVTSTNLLTVAAGTDQGIEKNWTAKLVNGAKVIADLELVRVDKTTAVVRLSATIDDLKRGLSVRFFPPAK